MPKQFKNVNTSNLTKDERLEFQALGYSDKEIDKVQEALKAERWLFWAKAKELFITLAGGERIELKNGKPVATQISKSLKFTANYAAVNDRETAKLVFQSDAYRARRVKLAAEFLADEKSAAYAEFKDRFMRDPEMIEQIRKELLGTQPAV